MGLFSEEDKNLWGAANNNKLVVLTAVGWLILFKKNSPGWVLEILANYLLIHDGKDIGLFNRLHHWQSGYLMRILNISKNSPDQNRKATILKGLSTMFDAKKRERFLRSNKL